MSTFLSHLKLINLLQSCDVRLPEPTSSCVCQVSVGHAPTEKLPRPQRNPKEFLTSCINPSFLHLYQPIYHIFSRFPSSMLFTSENKPDCFPSTPIPPIGRCAQGRAADCPCAPKHHELPSNLLRTFRAPTSSCSPDVGTLKTASEIRSRTVLQNQTQVLGKCHVGF